MQLLKNVTVDKKTGLAMKIDEDGNVYPLTDEEKERMSFIVIEICLFIYAKYVKEATQLQLDKYREKI